jgi:hypothetical protein
MKISRRHAFEGHAKIKSQLIMAKLKNLRKCTCEKKQKMHPSTGLTIKCKDTILAETLSDHAETGQVA